MTGRSWGELDVQELNLQTSVVDGRRGLLKLCHTAIAGFDDDVAFVAVGREVRLQSRRFLIQLIGLVRPAECCSRAGDPGIHGTAASAAESRTRNQCGKRMRTLRPKLYSSKVNRNVGGSGLSIRLSNVGLDL